jgi:hypothetical protein
MGNGSAILLAIVAVCMSVSSQAATFEINPIITAVFDTAFTPLPNPPGVPGINTPGNGGPAVYQVDFMLEVISLQGAEDSFGETSFDIVLGPGLSDAADIGWQANTPTIDWNGALPGGVVPMFLHNGPDIIAFWFPGDASTIFVSMATYAFTNPLDPRRSIGEGSPYLLGSLFVQWDGITYSQLSLDNVQFSVKLVDGSFVAGQPGSTGRIVFGLNDGLPPIDDVWPPIDPEVPEPATLTLVALGIISLALRRRGKA